MIVFTIIGLLVFWSWCFAIGFYLIPTYLAVRAAWAVYLFGPQVGHLIAAMAAYGAEGDSNG